VQAENSVLDQNAREMARKKKPKSRVLREKRTVGEQAKMVTSAGRRKKEGLGG